MFVTILLLQQQLNNLRRKPSIVIVLLSPLKLFTVSDISLGTITEPLCNKAILRKVIIPDYTATSHSD